jgi:hypothetical protein
MLWRMMMHIVKKKMVMVCMNSGGSAMEMDRKSRAMAHEYTGGHEGDHSKEYYEKKYGNYEHEKNHMKEEGSSMKEEAMKMKEMEHKRMDEGSKM